MKRLGRNQSAGKGDAHPIKIFEGHEPSFSLICADSGLAVKGDSMLPNPQDALPLPPRPSLERYKKLAKQLVKSAQFR